MKIISEGNTKFHRWWSGKTATCRTCQTVVELEAADELGASTIRQPPFVFIVSCPLCTGDIILKNTGAHQ